MYIAPHASGPDGFRWRVECGEMGADTAAPARDGSAEDVREGPLVAETCAELRGLDPAPVVLVGGQAFGGSAERALRTGADAYAEDAEAAVAAVRERFAAPT